MYNGFIFLAAGILSRMFIPWLVLLYKNRDSAEDWSWEWRYLRGQAIASLVVFVGLPFLLGDLEAIGGWDYQAAWLSGYGIAEIGRFVDKALTE